MSVHALTHSCNVLRGDMTNTKYSDLQLCTEQGESVQCHKVILINISNKVKKALERKDCDKVVIRSVKFGGLKALVQFIYDGRVDIENSDDLMDFVDAFSLLQINLGPKIAKTVQNIAFDNETEKDTTKSSDQLTYKCETCNKLFKLKKQLTRHIREVHEKQTPKKKQSYACETCGSIHTVRISKQILTYALFLLFLVSA